MKNILIAAVILIFTAILTTPAIPAQQGLSGEWTLTRMVRDTWDVPVMTTGKVPTIKFSGEGFSGNGSCNSYGGSYTLEGGKGFKPGAVRSTKMACVQPEINGQEKAFFAILEKVTSYEITGDMLKLAGEGGAYSLTFTRKSAEEELPFLWIVDKKQVDCRGVVHQNCLQVKKRDFDQWEILREKIGGFVYKPGRYYLLRVRHSDKGYKLVKIISRTRLIPHVD
jgi:heat shock protein HslJ